MDKNEMLTADTAAYTQDAMLIKNINGKHNCIHTYKRRPDGSVYEFFQIQRSECAERGWRYRVSANYRFA